ncbi:MAG: DUF5107 domain-containing protein, partial [Spirochaetales bacterium]|nr:DUF5107 domain-containing protein [Spirochaetales bacterium]
GDGSFRDEDRIHLGYETGFRVLPYLMQDSYSREKEDLELDTVILENENLKALFLPSMGGRLLSLYHKKLKKELLFRNPVLQPANLATRDAWFSGGIEWNIGIYGHSPLTCSPLFFGRVKDSQGHEFLRAWEYERCRKIYFSMDFHLPPGAAELAVHVRIVNAAGTDVPMYWWTNIAVPETKETRVFSESDDVIYIKPESNEKENSTCHFGRSTLQNLPSLPDKDGSYPGNFDFASEYFFQTDSACRSPWEASLQKDGTLFYERSTPLLRYRKMFCWGMQKGGRHWCDFLSLPGEGDYLEIQGGMAPTQLHGMVMPAGAEWTFTQYFSGLDASDEDLSGSWTEARDRTRRLVTSRLDESAVEKGHDFFYRQRENSVEEILSKGSGWGSLEQMMQNGRKSPPGMEFPASALDEEQQDWLELLAGRGFHHKGAGDLPLSYMVDTEWAGILEEACSRGDNNPWPLVMLGILFYEQDRKDRALALWKDSLQMEETMLACRNIAVYYRETGQKDKALEYYTRAFQLCSGDPGRPLCEEILSLYIRTENYTGAWDFYSSLAIELRNEERLISLAAVAAYETARFDILEQIFKKDFPSIREGETRLMDLWVRNSARKLAHVRNIPIDAGLMEEARRACPPPPGIDFSMT